jgi:hypothetical protein
MIDRFIVPSFYVDIQTVLSLYSSGRTIRIAFYTGDELSFKSDEPVKKVF